MVNSTFEKWKMYITSLWFLFFLILIITADIPISFEPGSKFIGFKELGSRNVIPIFSVAMLGIGLFFVHTFNMNLKGSVSSSFKIKKIRNKNYEHLTFLTTYIIPLICFDLGSLRYVIVLLVLLIIIGVMYVKTDMFYANPTLAIMNFQLYEADVELRDGIHEGVILISRSRVELSSSLVYRKLDEKIYFVRSV
ncbi:anti-phage protein KwaA [Acetoanaerobium noterae]|uniref:anti-phage protein KwaA n=1 Tax=Acetoanaerobium noterae TaxID=745369 RepID=UPI0028A8C7FD|nr:anti-phage protein KwaA [Acetoanaerobium noterae]